jgi:poly-beta-1,6-N-acetyl-D-glucosamine synthase
MAHMELVFWVSVGLVVYVYAGYPALVAAWSAIAARPVRRHVSDDSRFAPSVSVVVAARNEAARLPGRVANLLGQEYAGPLEIIVVSDGSTDGTRETLAHLDDRIRFLERPRSGKAAALNAGVAAARGDIVVFADARQRFAPDAIRHLVASFQDPDVGGVTGELVLDCEQRAGRTGSTIGEGVGLYWRFEKWLRRQESAIRSTLGATGAIYALRRALWTPLPPSTLLDDVLAPMRVTLAGHRIVFEERARAYDRVAPDGQAEVRRKTRTLAGNYQMLALEPRLLLPVVNPVWLQYVSHKIGRLLVPWALVLTLFASSWLAREHWIYALALIVQLGFYGLAGLGGWLESRQRDARRRADELSVASE